MPVRPLPFPFPTPQLPPDLDGKLSAINALFGEYLTTSAVRELRWHFQLNYEPTNGPYPPSQADFFAYINTTYRAEVDAYRKLSFWERVYARLFTDIHTKRVLVALSDAVEHTGSFSHFLSCLTACCNLFTWGFKRKLSRLKEALANEHTADLDKTISLKAPSVTPIPLDPYPYFHSSERLPPLAYTPRRLGSAIREAAKEEGALSIVPVPAPKTLASDTTNTSMTEQLFEITDNNREHCEILGLTSPDMPRQHFSFAELREAYKRCALKTHPDRQREGTGLDENAFKQVEKAYTSLISAIRGQSLPVFDDLWETEYREHFNQMQAELAQDVNAFLKRYDAFVERIDAHFEETIQLHKRFMQDYITSLDTELNALRDETDAYTTQQFIQQSTLLETLRDDARAQQAEQATLNQATSEQIYHLQLAADTEMKTQTNRCIHDLEQYLAAQETHLQTHTALLQKTLALTGSEITLEANARPTHALTRHHFFAPAEAITLMPENDKVDATQRIGSLLQS